MSGYCIRELERAITPGIVGFQRRVSRQNQGGDPIHRKGSVIKKSTFAKQLTISSDWFKKKPTNKSNFRVKSWGKHPIPEVRDNRSPSAPFFVPRTPGGGLASQLKKVEVDINRLSSQKVKIVEEGGVTLKDLLCNPAPRKEKTCIREHCQVCRFEGSKGGCKVRSVCYAEVCLDCEKKGEKWTY